MPGIVAVDTAALGIETVVVDIAEFGIETVVVDIAASDIVADIAGGG